MAAKWIIGRAGTGKTEYCLSAMARESQRQPLGPPIYMLVPEQAAFMTERRLITRNNSNTSGSFRIRVVGIKRFCRLIAGESGLPDLPEITPVTRIVLLTQTLRQCHDQLTIFKTCATQPGFLRTLDAMLAEWEQNNQTAQSMRALATKSSADPVLVAKLTDMALLLETWDTLTMGQLLDGQRLPSLVADKLATGNLLENSHVYVDAFSSMNALEMRLLAQIARTAASLTITLLADPASARITNPNLPLDSLDLFHRTELLYRRISQQLQQAGAQMAPSLYLTQSHRLQSRLLKRMETDLWQGPANPSDHAAPVSTVPDAATDEAVELWSGSDPESEVLAAARYIQRRVADGLRYRDIGLVVTDLTKYEEAVSRIFLARNIPHFMDQRRPLAHHPLLELLRGAITLANRKFVRADVLGFVKTRLAGVAPSDAFAMENYMLAHGIDGDDLSRAWQWQTLPADPDAAAPRLYQSSELTAANRARQAIRTALEPWLNMARPAADPTSTSGLAGGGQFADALLELLSRLAVKETLEDWMTAERSAGVPELAQIHEQAWEQTHMVLLEMRRLLADSPMSLTDFGQLLLSALQTLTLGLVPPALDQVLVSSAQRSRHPELREVIVLGAIETQFPKVDAEDPMLDNRQRRFLNSISHGCVNPGSDESLLQARFFDYVAFTRASEKLIVSWPEVDTQGSTTARSFYVEQLEKWPGVKNRKISRGAAGLLEATDTRDILDAVVLALADARGTAGKNLNGETAGNIAAAYSVLWNQTAGPMRHLIQQSWRGLAGNSATTLSEQSRRQFAANFSGISVSQLQTFAACHLKYFLQYTLGLRPQSQLALDQITLGQIYHRVMEQFYHGIIYDPVHENASWPNWSRGMLVSRLTAVMHEVSLTLEKELFARQPETRSMFTTIHRNLLLLLEAHRRAAMQNPFRPFAVESGFGTYRDTEGKPGFELDLPDGTKVPVLGKIDRLDAAPDGTAFLLDYKSSTGHNFNALWMKEGLELQLVCYLLALEGTTLPDGSKIKPIGAFYQNMKPKANGQKKDGELIYPMDDQFYKDARPRGLFNDNYANILETGELGVQSGKWFPMRYTNGGTVHKGGGHDGVPADQFPKLLELARQTMRRLATEMRAGPLAPNPYRKGKQTACGQCDLKSLCTFDRLYGHYRGISGVSGKEAIAVVLGLSNDAGAANDGGND